MPRDSATRRRPGAARATRVTGATRRRRLILWLELGTLIVVAAIIAPALLPRRAAGGRPGLVDPDAFLPTGPLLSVGRPAPDFDLATTDGARYRLSAQRGHPVVLEFFAVWCPVCQGEAPVLAGIDAAFKAKGVRTLAILANPYGRDYDTSGNTDQRPVARGDIAWFARTFGATAPTLIDPSFATVNRYGVQTYPTLYVVDGAGVIRAVETGATDYNTLAAQVAAAGR